MEKMISMMLAITALPLFFASAQAPQRPRPDLPAQQRLNREIKANIQKGGPQTERTAELQEALKGEPDVEPSDEMNVSEFQLQRNELKGKVVELTFDKVISLKQAGQESYIAVVTYESPRMAEGLHLVVPAAGLDFFEDLSRPEIRRRESVYIQVINPSTVKALGTRYSGSKPEGERYGW
jgi:hypothetical protein